MSVFVAFALLAFSWSFSGHQSMLNSEKEVKEAKTFAELSSEAKKEAIKHILISGDCSWKGIPLHGKVEIVESFADIKVEIVDAFPDIRVKWVNAFANDCGEWEKVESFGDFKIELVNSFPDLKIKEVDAFPGMN